MSETDTKTGPDADVEECRKHGKPCCIAALVIVVISIVCGIWTTCNPPGSHCPTVTPVGEGMTLDTTVGIRADLAVEQLLLNPESYKRTAIYGMRTYPVSREDGSEYYGRMQVEFTATNNFGHTGAGIATVRVSETKEDGCVVTHTDLH